MLGLFIAHPAPDTPPQGEAALGHLHVCQAVTHCNDSQLGTKHIKYTNS